MQVRRLPSKLVALATTVYFPFTQVSQTKRKAEVELEEGNHTGGICLGISTLFSKSNFPFSTGHSMST